MHWLAAVIVFAMFVIGTVSQGAARKVATPVLPGAALKPGPARP